jgi:hypothetical protein
MVVKTEQRNKGIKATEKKLIRRTAGYSLLDHRRDGDISEKIKVDPVEKKLSQHKQQWLKTYLQYGRHYVPKTTPPPSER